MKRSMCGLAGYMAAATLAVAAATLTACSGDPTGDLRGSADTLLVNPGFLVMTPGENATVLAVLRDEQGNSLPANVTALSGDVTVATVEPDTTFRPGLGQNRLSQQFIIKAASFTTGGFDSTTIVFTSGSKGLSLPVLITPDGTSFSDITFSSNALAAGEPVTITSNGQVAFDGATVFRFDAGGIDTVARVQSVTANSATLIPIPGSHGVVTISGAQLVTLPSIGRVTVTTEDSIVVPTSAPLPFSSLTPVAGQTLTISSDGYFDFDDSTVVLFDIITTVGAVVDTTATPAFIASFTANDIVVIPIPGSAGVATLTGTLPRTAPTTGRLTITTVSALGAVPTSAPLPFSSLNTVAGQTLTITSDGNLDFDTLTVVSFDLGGTATPALIVSVTANSIVVIPIPGSAGIATVTGAVSRTAPTSGRLTVTTVLALGAVPTTAPFALSTATPAIGQTVTLTTDGRFTFDDTTTVSFDVAGAPTPVVITLTQPGSIQFLPIPGSSGPAVVEGALPTADPTAGRLDIVSVATLVVPPVLAIPATFSDATPDINEAITATAAGFKFLPNVVVQFNGVNQPVTAVAADSNSVTFRVANAGNAVVTFQNVALDFLTQVPLSLSSAATLAPTATVITLTGTDAIATAPSIGAFGATEKVTVTSGGAFNASGDCTGGPGGYHCHIFEFTLTEDGAFDVTSSWNNDSDLGIYFSDAINDDVFPGFGCDAHGPGAGGGNFETCSVDLTAGTYYLQVVTFAPLYPPPNNINPTQFSVTLTGP